MLYEIHMLKNYPPTNLNRDDTGAPKTCYFGGTTRGRISSQCLKRSWRTSEIFKEEIGEENIGIRTRKLPEIICEKLQELGIPSDYLDAVKPHITGIGNKSGDETKDGKTAQVILYAPEDIEAVALAVKGKLDSCKTVKEVEKLNAKELLNTIKGAGVRPVSLDIALFGRMVTCDAFRDVEASMQVAHAISTNKVNLESDYYTAMDDLLGSSDENEQGSAMIGDIDYNASCYYLYAALDTDILKENLKYSDDPDELIRKALPALLRAMAYTNPSGKQNSFAGHILPSAVLVECKEKKIPTSLVNAFSDAVTAKDPVKESIKKLMEEADMLARNYALPVREKLWFCVDKYNIRPESATKVFDTFPALCESAVQLLN